MNRIIKPILLLPILSLAAVCVAQQDIPSSSRSQAAINRIKPELEQKLSEKKLKLGAPIFIRIFKAEMVLEVWLRGEKKFRLFRAYPICTYGYGGLGPKIRQGDGKAPEGFYFVTPSRLNPLSKFHLSFNLGYPNRFDRHHGRTGSALMVHGSCVSIGCYAMTDLGIEAIYALADAAFRNGQSFFRVHVFPFRMNKENMEKHRNARWYEFWSNLKEGYDFFESAGNIPPNVEVQSGKYVFEKQ